MTDIIEHSESYLMLSAGEIIQAGDEVELGPYGWTEFLSGSRYWVLSDRVGETVPDPGLANLRYRRCIDNSDERE